MSALGVAAAGVAGLVLKATLVLCLALALAWLARRGSARTPHLLWTTTFVVLLALPLVSLLGPSWPVPILPARDAQTEMPSLEQPGERASVAGMPREMPGAPISGGSARQVTRLMTASGSSPVESGLAQLGASDLPSPLTLSAIAFVIWAVGCAAALVSLVVGDLRFRKLVRAAVPMSKPGWLQQAASIRRLLGTRRNVRILSSARATTPMTGGLWRPVILLPSSAETWAPDRREVVLAHELVHVRRHDALRHLLGRVAAACYWFHPLGWLASRLSAVASERSCDEEVLALGTRPSEYARHLFSLASETAGRPAALALGMVQRSQLEDRILSILRRHRPRYSAVGTTSALAAIGMVGTLLACGNPVPGEPAPQPTPGVETPLAHETRAQDPSIHDPTLEPTPPVTPVREPPTPENAQTERLAAAPVSPHPFQCNPGRWTIVRRSGEWTLQRHVDGLRMCMRNHGNFDIGSQNVATDSSDEGSWLVLESQAERLHRLVVTRGPGGLEYEWSIDGRSEVFDARAEEWRDLMLTVMNGDLEVQDVLADESRLREIGWAHRRHVSGLRRQIGAHQRRVGGLQRQIGAHQRHISDLHRQLARTDDLAQEVQEIEKQIEEYDLDGRIREIEIQIEEYDLDGKLKEAEARVEEFDADGRIDEIERSLEDEIAALRRIVG